jgi:hypothetical protein
MMKVRFDNGFETEMRDEVAKKYIAKGRVKQVKEVSEKKSPGRPKKAEEPKPEQVAEEPQAEKGGE